MCRLGYKSGVVEDAKTREGVAILVKKLRSYFVQRKEEKLMWVKLKWVFISTCNPGRERRLEIDFMGRLQIV